MLEPIEVDVVITMRPWSPPPGFVCVVCGRERQDGRWNHEKVGEPPICLACVRHWCSLTRLPIRRVTRGDKAALQRLSAILTALNWEIANGRRRWA